MEGQQNESTIEEKEDVKRSLLRSALDYFGELIRVVVISLAIILPVRYFLIQPFYVKGASMEPSFYDHEYLVIDELSYRLRDPARGEIIVFRYPNDPRQFFIKRVIGLPDETVQFDNGKIIIKNTEHPKGFVLQEQYLDPALLTTGGQEITLGREKYYLLGDNRTSSLDSRYFGALTRSYIIGRVWIRGWPLDRVTKFLTPTYNVDKDV